MDALTLVQPDTWSHVKSLDVHADLRKTSSQSEEVPHVDQVPVASNLWQIFARLLISIGKVRLILDKCEISEDDFRAAVYSPYWRDHVRFLGSLCTPVASTRLPKLVIHIFNIEPYPFEAEICSTFVQPLMSLPFAEVSAELTMENEFDDDDLNANAMAAIFGPACVSKVHLDVSNNTFEMCLAFRNLSSLSMHFEKQPIAPAFWTCLNAIGANLEVFRLRFLPSTIDDRACLPTKLPNLKRIECIGRSVTPLWQVVRKISMPILQSISLHLFLDGTETLSVHDRLLHLVNLHSVFAGQGVMDCAYNLAITATLSEWCDYVPILAPMCSSATLSIEASLRCDAPDGNSGEAGAYIVDAHSLAIALPPEIRSAMVKLHLTLEGDSMNPARGLGERIALTRLTNMTFDISPTTRTWSTFILSHLLDCISAPALKHIVWVDRSHRDVLTGHLLLLHACLVLWPELRTLNITLYRCITTAEQRADLSNLSAACEQRKIKCILSN